MSRAAAVLAHALDRPPALGAGRLICIDGPSGSGKSTLARELAELTPATVVHTDDLCPGWDGLPQVPGLLLDLLAPLAQGRPGSYPRYDWILGSTAGPVVVPPSPLLVIEGVGAGARLLEPLRCVLVFLDGDPVERRNRAIERDGEYFAEFWDDWMAAENAFFASEDVRACADLAFSS